MPRQSSIPIEKRESITISLKNKKYGAKMKQWVVKTNNQNCEMSEKICENILLLDELMSNPIIAPLIQNYVTFKVLYENGVFDKNTEVNELYSHYFNNTIGDINTHTNFSSITQIEKEEVSKKPYSISTECDVALELNDRIEEEAETLTNVGTEDLKDDGANDDLDFINSFFNNN